MVFGAHQSGKTTVFKQIKHLYQEREYIVETDVSDLKREIRVNLFWTIFTKYIFLRFFGFLTYTTKQIRASMPKLADYYQDKDS